MGKIARLYDTWSNRVTTTAALWTIIPAGVLGVLSGWASTSLEWFDQFGWFGVLWAGLIAFFVSSAALALLGRTRLWRVESRIRERLNGDSTPFDPMASVYQDKQLFLRDLAPAGRQFVAGKKFINCEIIGPGTAKLLTRSTEHKPWPVMSNNFMHYTDIVESNPEAGPENAIFFPDCSFQDCHFFNLTLLFDDRQDGIGWNWITRDYRQPILTDQSKDLDDD